MLSLFFVSREIRFWLAGPVGLGRAWHLIAPTLPQGLLVGQSWGQMPTGTSQNGAQCALPLAIIGMRNPA